MAGNNNIQAIGKRKRRPLGKYFRPTLREYQRAETGGPLRGCERTCFLFIGFILELCLMGTRFTGGGVWIAGWGLYEVLGVYLWYA